MSNKFDLKLWPKRIGHVHFRILCQMFSTFKTHKEDNINIVYPFAKQTTLSFCCSNTSSVKAFDLVHIDV